MTRLTISLDGFRIPTRITADLRARDARRWGLHGLRMQAANAAPVLRPVAPVRREAGRRRA